MTVAEYYVTTMVTAFGKIAPVVAFIGIGYFIFFKLPFLFLLKNMTNYKNEMREDNRGLGDFKKDYSLEDYEDFKRRMKRINKPIEKEEIKRLAEPEKPKKKAEPKKESKPTGSPAENLFELRPGQSISKNALRKKYHDLLKQNHPDKVASLGEDFKALAEKKTKEINEAYNKLKSRAS